MPKPEFEKLEELHGAILSLGKLLSIPYDEKSEKIDDAFNYIKNINKKEIDTKIQDEIIRKIREGLLKIYYETIAELNDSIGDMDLYTVDNQPPNSHNINRIPPVSPALVKSVEDRKLEIIDNRNNRGEL